MPIAQEFACARVTLLTVSVDAERRFDEASRALAVWDARCAASSVWFAWREAASEQRDSRRTFDELASDSHPSVGLRAMAAVNAGNAFDKIGRSIEAIERYCLALRLVPGFGMALGNRGMTLARLAPRLHEEHAVLRAAARADLLDAVDPGRGLDPAARATFEDVLSRLGDSNAPGRPSAEAPRYTDAYAEWAFQQRLLLTATPDIRPEASHLDPLRIHHLVVSIERPDVASPGEFGALNAMRRDYLAARFQTWMALVAPEVGDLASRSGTAHYTDTLDYARWDLPTGLAAAALSAAVSLTDKIGSFLVLWLGLGEPARPDHRSWAFATAKDGTPTLRAGLVTLMEQHGDLLSALLGLIDQAHETWDAGSPAEARGREIRNAAVHRFLTVHDEGAGHSSGPTLAISHLELKDQTIAALAHARRLLLQLLVAIDEREALHGHTAASLVMPAYKHTS